jgi:hypothetical protein
MILISHPRSGSELLLRGSTFTYGRFELFNEFNKQTAEKFKGISFGARFSMLKNQSPQTAQKFHTCHLRHVLETSFLGPDILKHLQERDDVYFIERLDKRKAIISEWVAMINGENYHDDMNALKVARSMPFNALIKLHRTHVLDTDFVRPLLTYRETFTMEGLVSGENTPKTFDWKTSRSNTQIRETWRKGFVPNLDQVSEWMDMLSIPWDENRLAGFDVPVDELLDRVPIIWDNELWVLAQHRPRHRSSV